MSERWRSAATLLLLASFGLLLGSDEVGSVASADPTATVSIPARGTPAETVAPSRSVGPSPRRGGTSVPASSGGPSSTGTTTTTPTGDASGSARPDASPRGATPTQPTATSVARGKPVSIDLVELGYSSRTPRTYVEPANAIIPPDFQHTFWLADRGVAPAPAAKDTTYFACHTNSRKSVRTVPCNALSDRVQPGQTVRVTLEQGNVDYEVTKTMRVRRSDLADNQEVWGVHPGRLVWVTCYITERRRTDYNFVIVAQRRD